VAGPGNILIKVGADAGQAVRELATLDKSLGSTMTTHEKMSAGLKKAALPAAAALGAIGYAAIGATKAAMEDAAAQDALAGQLERTAHATKGQVSAAEDYISALSLQTGIADDELRPALGKLAAATHDVAKGQELLGLAVDISAQSGEDLGTVSDALAKGYLGQTRALGKLVPGVDKATLASKDMTKITAELADLTGGAASQAAKTAAGQYKIFQVQMSELQEAIGAGLIPVVKALMPIMTKSALFAQEHAKAVQILVGVVAALAAGILVANAALKAYAAAQAIVKAATVAWTAVQWLLNAALSANPIGLVIVAVAALAAGIVVAYKKSETFRDVVRAAFSAVQSAVAALERAFSALERAATAAWNWIASHWKLALFAFGPIGAAIYLISENFDKVKSAATAAFDFVKSAWNVGRFAFGPITAAIQAVASAFDAVAGAARAAIGVVQSLIGWIARVSAGAIRDVTAAVAPAINAVRDLIHWIGRVSTGPIDAVAHAIWNAIDAVRDLISWIGRIHVPHINLPGPFALPPAPGPAPAVAGVTAAAAPPLTINVYGAVDPEGTARAIRRLLLQHDRRQGRAA